MNMITWLILLLVTGGIFSGLSISLVVVGKNERVNGRILSRPVWQVMVEGGINGRPNDRPDDWPGDDPDGPDEPNGPENGPKEPHGNGRHGRARVVRKKNGPNLRLLE